MAKRASMAVYTRYLIQVYALQDGTWQVLHKRDGKRGDLFDFETRGDAIDYAADWVAEHGSVNPCVIEVEADS